jgi:hypothetical protein
MSMLGKLGILAALAVLAYAPFLPLPLISDDYLQIYLGRQFGPVEGWRALADDVLYRSRATSLLLTYGVDSWFGIDATAHRLLNLLLHIANTGLVLLLGVWKRIGWRISVPAAAFFAIHEGHQEAVVWSAAMPELLVFLCGVGCVLAWIREKPMLAATLYAAALLSKESAVAVWPLLAWYWWQEQGRSKERVPWLVGMALVSVVYAAGIFAASRTHLHLNDGTFSLSAPVWWTLPHSMHRLLWIWGWLALALLAMVRAERRIVVLSLGWIAVTLLPYSFLTYMDRVPSRHIYLASAGLALLVGAAFAVLRERWERRWQWLPVAVALGILMQNVGYLWTKKLEQYERRAEVTERFLREAAKHQQPIHLKCAAHGLDVYRYAAMLRLGSSEGRVRRVAAAGDAVPYCDPVHP